MSPCERVGLLIAGAAMVLLGFYGFTTGAPSTLGYLISVVLVGSAIWWLRTTPLPDWLAVALGIDAAMHLAGGLVSVGRGVLYDGHLGTWGSSVHTHFLQYDHLVHSFGSFLAAVTFWVLLAPPGLTGRQRRGVIALCVLAGAGVGAINEIVEFTATLMHHGAHVGGYDNTGWDLVCNLVGAVAAGFLLASSHGPEPQA